jgi:enoyl-CoA hydratase/carnithine racemase
MDFEFFTIKIDAGVALVTFERPPVNALSEAAYREIIKLSAFLDSNDDVRCVVFAGSDKCKAWIGGADLNDFVKLDYQSRIDRYDLVNEANDAFYRMSKPVVAAIGSHAIGAGMTFAAICDIRVAARDMIFCMPEIERGTTSGGGIPFNRLFMPVGRMREMLFTGRRFRTEELESTGFFNYIVSRGEVLDKSMELAQNIAGKSLFALQATKISCNESEVLPREEGRRLSQEYTARITASKDGQEGIRSFLEKRRAVYTHKEK